MGMPFNEKFLAYLVLVCGLSVSAVAVYYSVIGLTAIFAAAVIPVIIMGTVLEISKLAATVWLKQYWSVAPRLLRSYLVVAVLLLMVITSMGIFGFLSRAHIEQTADTQENSAKLQNIKTEITRQQQLIERNETRIKQIESGNTGQNAQTQRQIDIEQSRIDQALKRIEPAIQEQNAIISSRIGIYKDQIDKIDQDLNRLQNSLNSGNITQAQAQVGVQPDGQLGPRSRQAITEYRDRLTAQRTQLANSMQQAESDPVIAAARKEIQRIRSTNEQQIAQSNQVINRLQSQLGRADSGNIDQQVEELRTAINTYTQNIEKLNSERFLIESAVRKLEAELGPIKYLAKFVYGEDADRDLLEKAVSWMIILLIIVFDPLAVMLLLASQISFTYLKQNRNLQVQPPIPEKQPDFDISKHAYLFKPWQHFRDRWPITKSSDSNSIQKNNEILSAEPAQPVTEIEIAKTKDQPHDIDYESLEEKEATRIWKQVNPEKTLKDQRDKVAAGFMSELPWQKLITPLHVTQFGLEFPADSKDGDLFCRTNGRPTAIYKYYDGRWIEIDQANKGYYTFGTDYIDWLINEIDFPGYPVDQLSENEKQAIEDRLQR